jgi:hypothetical protein
MKEFASNNKGTKFLLNVIDLFSKYAWSVPLKDKTGESIVKAFDKITTIRKPNKLWVDKGKEFYNKTFDKWLKTNNISLYSTFNEGKAVVIERFNRTMKARMWKYFTAQNTKKYIDILDKLIDQYNNNYHSSIKMTPVEASKKHNENVVRNNLYNKISIKLKKGKFKIGDRVRIYRYKTVFEKGYTPNWTKEIFEVYKIQNTVPTTYLIKDLSGEEIQGSFYEQELQKTHLL